MAAVVEYLADQKMIPFAPAGSDALVTTTASELACTNAGVIQKFLAVAIAIEAQSTRVVRFAFRRR
jgi:RNA 3'-terminal phosphate cyclase (ATP)